MKIVLVRHGRKQGGKQPDSKRPLDPAEHIKAKQLRERLIKNGFDPHFILTSSHLHAVETAKLLKGQRTRKVIKVKGLTPRAGRRTFSLPAILHEAESQCGTCLWSPDECLLLVGHDKGLLSLANTLTGKGRELRLTLLKELTLNISVRRVKTTKL